MNYRKLGRTGLEVSEIGYGAWGIGGALWTDSNDEESLASIRRALELGVNFFDTAYVYGDGHSEALLGKAFKEFGKRPYVATKVPPKNGKWPSSGTIQEAFPGDWMRRCVERSLTKLGSDSVEVLQLHGWVDAWIDQPGWDATVQTLESLKREGKIRFWGVSVNSREPESAARLAATGLIDTVQVIYNLFEQAPREVLFPACRAKGVAVIARVPFDEGGLTGKLTETTKFPPDDYRTGYFRGRLLNQTVERARALEKKLVGGDVPDLAHAALRFCLSHSDVATVIPGMRKPAHVEANLSVSGRPSFPAALLEDLKAHAWRRDWSTA